MLARSKDVKELASLTKKKPSYLLNFLRPVEGPQLIRHVARLTRFPASAARAASFLGHFLRSLLARNGKQHLFLAFDPLSSALALPLAVWLLCAHALTQGIHEIDNIRGRPLFRRFNLDAARFFLDQVL